MPNRNGKGPVGGKGKLTGRKKGPCKPKKATKKKK